MGSLPCRRLPFVEIDSLGGTGSRIWRLVDDPSSNLQVPPSHPTGAELNRRRTIIGVNTTERSIFHGRVSGNHIVLKEDASAFDGHEVTVQVEDSSPRRGSWEAVERVFGIVVPPPGFDPDKVTRDDIYE